MSLNGMLVPLDTLQCLQKSTRSNSNGYVLILLLSSFKHLYILCGIKEKAFAMFEPMIQNQRNRSSCAHCKSLDKYSSVKN